MKILVVGGAGYIGSHVVWYLKEKGYEPVVVDNLCLGHREAIEYASFYKEDLSNTQAIDNILQKEGPFAAVMHFAALSSVGESVQNPLEYYCNNVANTIHLLRCLVHNGIKNFVFSSSAAVYGDAQSVPITEEASTSPINPYGRSKQMIENILQDSKDIQYCVLRYFNAAGAHPYFDIGEDHSPETHLIPIILKKGLAVQSKTQVSPVKIFGTDYPTRDGTAIRDYVHVCDIANAHILALENLLATGDSDIFNIGSGLGYSVREIVQAARTVTNIDIPAAEEKRREGDPAVLIASSQKIRNTLGWSAKYSDIHDILTHAWQWHKKYPNGYNI